MTDMFNNWNLEQPEQTVSEQNLTIQRQPMGNVFTFGGAKRSGSDRECKYFPIGMNAREPLWH